MRWTGVEEMDVGSVGFSWRARFPLLPGLWLAVEDSYRQGAGVLRGRLWGRIPLFSASGADANVAQALRYLAELPWVPYAMTDNPELRWKAVHERCIEVSIPSLDPRVAVRFDFDEEGDVVAASARSRPRGVRGGSVETPWGGKFSNYVVLDGLRIPRYGEVHWDLPDGRFVYWKGEVTAAHAGP